MANRYLAASGVPYGLRPGFLETRRRVRTYLDALPGNYKKDGGISGLAGAELATAESFFDDMERFGLFTVRNGELESWLPNLGVRARKEGWLAQMFDRLGSERSDQNFVLPAEDDVWALMRRMNSWISRADRDGMIFLDPVDS